MTPTTDTYVLLRAFVDELVRCGMRVACTSPGSRCAPLVLTLARDERLRCYSHVDERCAGFFALGAAKSSGLPVAVTCTSGTAAAELLPAAIEAFQARVPLLLLTADRPPELRENGAGQAIDQLKLYGSAAKWFVEVGTHEATPERVRWMRTLACRSYWTALEGRPGVVHLNFPLREPLICDEPLPDDETGRQAGRPYVARSPVSARDAGTGAIGGAGGEDGARPGGETGAGAGGGDGARLRTLVAGSRRGVVVAGRYERDAPLGREVAKWCEATGWPLLADPMSGARRGTAAVAHYDALLRSETFAGSHRPDLVLRVGDLPVSKPLRTWLADLDDVPQVALDPEGAWQDPASMLSDSLALEPVAALRWLGAASTDPAADVPATDVPKQRAEDRQTRGAPTRGAPTLSAADPDWLAGWRGADEQAAGAINGAIAGEDLSEPAIAAELGVLLPAQATLFVASSMPVRDIETFWPVRDDPPRVLCNRGANGIDGTVSSAFGASACTDGPVVLLIGDVALAHDIGGLLAAGRLGLRLTIVLVDNDGGGIFDFLPVAHAELAQAGDVYRDHIATPTGLDFAKAAELYGLGYERVQTIPALRAALERALTPRAGCTLVHARTDRAENVGLHGRIWSAVAAAGVNGSTSML